MRVPKHIGVIPDGNRRWAQDRGMTKEKGYAVGVEPGLALFRLCKEAGVKEVTYYGFTMDNTKRPTAQRRAFTRACVQAVEVMSGEDCALLVVGNSESRVFPKELAPFTTRRTCGKGGIKVNILVNYGWEWDLNLLKQADPARKAIQRHLRSAAVSRVDLIIRWGGRRRLSGFLPVQSVYADFYVVDARWPDFEPEHFHQALRWYQEQDVTLGG
jgi:undecaprenyl diphosphate synthase